MNLVVTSICKILCYLHLYSQRFIHAWYAFVNLLDVDYKDGFLCPQCGQYPDTIVMDGTALGVRKTFLQWTSFMRQKGGKHDSDQLDGR